MTWTIQSSWHTSICILALISTLRDLVYIYELRRNDYSGMMLKTKGINTSFIRMSYVNKNVFHRAKMRGVVPAFVKKTKKILTFGSILKLRLRMGREQSTMISSLLLFSTEVWWLNKFIHQTTSIGLRLLLPGLTFSVGGDMSLDEHISMASEWKRTRFVE